MKGGMDAEAAPSPIRLTWLAAAFGCAATALAAVIGADARWLAAVGAAIVDAGSLPHAIPYAAAPSEWHDAPALGQLVFHGLESLLGDKGLVLAQLAAVGVALGALALDLRRAGVRDELGAAVLVAVVVAAPSALLVVRAQLYSIALFPLLVLLLRNDASRRSRRIWVAVPMLALWANLHGAVLVGFSVLATYLVLRRSRRLEAAAVLAASSAALLATPALLHTVGYYSAVLDSVPAETHYGLWARLSPGDPLDLLFIAIAVPMFAAGLRRRQGAWELTALVALAAMSITSGRNGIWFLLFAATPAALGLQRSDVPRLRLTRRTACVCACIPALMIAVGLARTSAPVGPTPRLLDKTIALAHGRPILAEPVDAEQLALQRRRIWIGNPIDAFARADQRLYLEWLQGTPTGDAILREPVGAVLVRRGSPAQQRLAATHQLREVGRDAQAVLYAGRE
jgi:hypothetical protein